MRSRPSITGSEVTCPWHVPREIPNLCAIFDSPTDLAAIVQCSCFLDFFCTKDFSLQVCSSQKWALLSRSSCKAFAFGTRRWNVYTELAFAANAFENGLVECDFVFEMPHSSRTQPWLCWHPSWINNKKFVAISNNACTSGLQSHPGKWARTTYVIIMLILHRLS